MLLGSRGDEEWLAAGTFGDNVYALPGLDPEAASNLADLILQRYKVTQWRGDKDFARLLKLLEGYPLPLEIVLANLQRQTPTEIVEALEAGLKEIDTSQEQQDREPARLHRLLLRQPRRGQPGSCCSAWRRSPVWST